MRSAFKTPDNDRSVSRTPLCDITNTIEDSILILGRAYTATLKSKFPETTRNLFADEEHPTFEKNKHLQDDEIGIILLSNLYPAFYIFCSLHI